MAQHFLLRLRPLGWVFLLATFVGAWLRPQQAQASHIRAGEIQANVDSSNPRRIFFKLTLYLDVSNTNNADQPSAVLFFGDGTSTCTGVPRASNVSIPNNTDTKVSTYYFDHIYPSTGGFNVEFIGENRNRGVVNMTNSDAQSFYLRTYVYVDPVLGLNHSPVFTAPAIDKAAIGQPFVHNPGAYDADGDLLTYHLIPSQRAAPLSSIVGPPCATGTGNNRPVPLPVPDFRLPNDPALTPGFPPLQVAYNGIPTGVVGDPAIFEQDSLQTGTITWNAPTRVGIYNFAFEVREYRRLPNGSTRLIGKVIRDMQIIVTATDNQRPIITIPPDLCVVAGQTVRGTVTAVDGASASSPATAVSLEAYSGILPPATFVQTQTGPPQASGSFTWRTDCSNVALSPYLVVFKAQDSPTAPTPVLIDEKAWRITVVGPAPENLRATPLPGSGGGINTIRLNWDTYTCTNASTIHIYRKVNQSSFTPGPCDTGIPASAGYVRIASVPASSTTYTDANTDASGTNQGLERGTDYCYRIYAEFPLPAGGASIASAEACARFGGRGVLLKNVDVTVTSATAGQIDVRWTQPRTSDNGPFAGTTSYVLSRAEGLSPAATAFAPVRTFTSLNDTTFVDTGLNTLDKQYTYQVAFVQSFPPGQGTTQTQPSPPASSVRVVAVPNLAGTQFTLSWTHNVPWDNAAQPTEVYRKLSTGTTYTRIGTATSTATGGSYVDSDASLVKGQRYCYYVRTAGRYAGFGFLSSLLNRSQEQCQALLSPPCTPVLTLAPTNCDSLANLAEFPRAGERYSNRLRWRLGNAPTGCDVAVSGYRVYYRARATGAFTLLGTTSGTSYEHRDLAFSGGCYAVQAVGASGVLSDTSNVACQDNCVFFKLPNVFTPNGDGVNDQFRPKNSSPVRRIHFQAFNRWGVKVFENTTTANDPILINWTGGGPVAEGVAGAKSSDGVYFYLAEVEFADFANTRRTYKGWVEIMR